MLNKKRVLFLSRQSPYGLSDGVKIRTYSFAKMLSKHYSLDLICQEDVSPPQDAYDPFEKKYSFKTSKLETIAKLLKALIKGKSAVYRSFDNRIKKFLDENSKDYEFVYCNYINTAINAMECGITKVGDLIDAISLHYKEAVNIGILRKILYKWDYKKVLAVESDIIDQFDLSIVTTSTEKEFLVKNSTASIEKLRNIKVLTHGVILSSDIEVTPRPQSSDKVIGFLGSLDYYPNEAAAIYLVKHIYPECKKRYPNLKCMIVGGKPTRKILKLSKMEGVIITGYVEDLRDTMSQIDVMVLPMKIASGIQNKLITSMGYGKAVVVANRAVFDKENLKDGVNLMTADQTEEYIQKILYLLTNDAQRVMIGENARNYIQTKLNWENVEISLISYIEEVLSKKNSMES